MGHGLNEIVFFGVGAALAVDYEETCDRLGLAVIGVRNREGEVFLSPRAKILGVEDATRTCLAVPCLCPIFTPAAREIAVSEAAAAGFRFAPLLVDPTSVVASSTQIGEGSYVNAACVIGGGGAIGRHVVVNRGSGIGHHAGIADFVSIGPGVVIAGHVTIEKAALIGAGAVILPRIRIGAGATVGAGAVVTRDVEPGTTVVGNPAKPRR